MERVHRRVGPVDPEQGDEAELVAAGDHRQLERQPVGDGRRLAAEPLAGIAPERGQRGVRLRRPCDGDAGRWQHDGDDAAYVVGGQGRDPLEAAAGQDDVEHRAVQRVARGRGGRGVETGERCGHEAMRPGSDTLHHFIDRVSRV